MSSDNNKFDEEWTRSVANPDNMIVSDSLLGRLALSESESAESLPTSTGAFMQCSIISIDGNVVSGRTASFHQTDDERSVSFETAHSTANTMLRFSDVKEIVFSFPSGESEVIWEVTGDEKVSKKTEFFGNNDALITITCVKEAKDPNSYTVTMGP